jgi:hypothetical protein
LSINLLLVKLEDIQNIALKTSTGWLTLTFVEQVRFLSLTIDNNRHFVWNRGETLTVAANSAHPQQCLPTTVLTHNKFL